MSISAIRKKYNHALNKKYLSKINQLKNQINHTKQRLNNSNHYHFDEFNVYDFYVIKSEYIAILSLIKISNQTVYNHLEKQCNNNFPILNDSSHMKHVILSYIGRNVLSYHSKHQLHKLSNTEYLYKLSIYNKQADISKASISDLNIYIDMIFDNLCNFPHHLSHY